jgi:hypothetical protein
VTRRPILAILLLVIPAAAAAEPLALRDRQGRLPPGITIDVERGIVHHGRTDLPLTDLYEAGNDSSGCDPKPTAATFDERTAVTEIATRCGAMPISSATLLSRLDRAEAWSDEIAGDLAGAAGRLAAALAIDPGFEAAAFDLAGVELARGHAGAAARALRPFVAKAPVASYARLAADPTLGPVLDAEPLSRLRAPQPGTARIAGIRAPFAAYSAAHDLIAVVEETPIGDGCTCRGGEDRRDVRLVVVDRGGRDVAGLSLVPPVDSCWTDAQLLDSTKETRQRIAVANRFLRDLGFDPVADAEQATFRSSARGSDTAFFARAKLGVAHQNGTARLLRGNVTLAEHELYACTKESHFNCEYTPTLMWAAWLPALRTVLVSWHTAGAEHSDRRTTLSVWRAPD